MTNKMNIDLYLFNLVNSLAGRLAWLDYFAMFCAEYLGYVLLVILALFLIFNYKKYWRMVLEAVIAAVITRFILTDLIRALWFRPRPFVALHFLPLISQSPTEASFPSGHASFFFALSTIVYFYNKKAGILFYVASIFIVIARVFTGVHWPSDILAGAILGILMGWLLNMLFRRHAHKIIKGYNN
jgi:undecaprenyl-diphosphatase